MFVRSVDILFSLPSLPVSQEKSKREVSDLRLENTENVPPFIPTWDSVSLERLEQKPSVEEHKNLSALLIFFNNIQHNRNIEKQSKKPRYW